jgi:NADPH-dependent curcumin reductase CurA
MAWTSREVRLVARPIGLPTLSDFRIAEREVRDPEAGEVLLRNRWFSLDTYMRGRMSGGWSYVPPFDLDVALDGRAVGEVIGSPGGVLPIVGELREGDEIFVSAAAGAVGIVAGQIAKLRGHRVIASTGSAEKVDYLTARLGFDAAFNYRDGAIGSLLGAAAPDGIDFYFDCVGGDHLEAAIDALRPGGRIAKVGGVAEYNAVDPVPGPRNLMKLVVKGLTLRGLGRVALETNATAFAEDAGTWLKEGRLHDVQTVVEGLEQAPQGFIDMLAGRNIGKMVVRVA